MKFKTEDLKIAEIRYFNKEANGLEVVGNIPFAIVKKQGNQYVNVFNSEMRCPTLVRAHQQNYVEGVYFGTKVAPINGIDSPEESGMCFILWNNCGLEGTFLKDEVSIEELENYVLGSSRFFIDRSSIASRKISEGICVEKMAKVLADDFDKVVDTEVFFSQRKCPIAKIKIK